MSVNFTSDPLSDEQIANYALRLRRFQGLADLETPDMLAILNRGELWTRFGTKRLEYLVVSDEELGGDEADTLISQSAIRIRFARTTHDRLKDFDRRSRFTAAHELGHAVLHKNPAPLARSPQRSANRIVPHFVSVEKQANTFASTYLITDAMAEHATSPGDLSENYLVSPSAADVRWERESRRRDRPRIGAGLRALAEELRNSGLARSDPRSSGPDAGLLRCPRCSMRTLIEFDGRYYCHACEGTPERFPDGDGPTT